MAYGYIAKLSFGGCDFANVFYKFDKTFSNNRIIAKQH